MKQKTTKLFVLPPPSAKLLLLLELSDLGDSRSILVDFMEVVSMKKLLFLSIGLVLSNLSSEIKAVTKSEMVPEISDQVLNNGLFLVDVCEGGAYNTNNPPCYYPFTYYAGYDKVNFCGIVKPGTSITFGQCNKNRNEISYIPANTPIQQASIITPVAVIANKKYNGYAN